MNSRLTLKEHSMTLSTDELLELARRVYPDSEWVVCTDPLLNCEFIISKLPRGNWCECDNFSPSLTGENWQKAQALQCIVAASKLGYHAYLYRHGQNYKFNAEDVCGITIMKIEDCPDLLHASCLALLAEGGS
jgi:hypothetical protein